MQVGARDPGTILTLRQATEADAGHIRTFVCGLSPRSQYLRFFTVAAPPSAALVRALCGGGRRGGADILLITDSEGAVVAHAMAVDEPGTDGPATNVGIVIADHLQHCGLGTLLLSALISRATSRGVRAAVMDVLPANDLVLGILQRRWPAAPRERTLDAITVRPALLPALRSATQALPATFTLPVPRSGAAATSPGQLCPDGGDRAPQLRVA